MLDNTNSGNTVEVDLWYATSLDLGTVLADELAAMSIDFGASHGNKPLFTPRIATYPCLTCDEEFKSKHCVSNGEYCGYTPSFYQRYNLDAPDSHFEITGREVIIQSLREKCLNRIMVDKYQDQGDMFWTYYGYDYDCFINPDRQRATSFDDCYDWSTVMINTKEHVQDLNDCVDKSFTRQKRQDRTRPDQILADMDSDNTILRQDRLWADQNFVFLHPAITINNITYAGDQLDGKQLESAICEAYR